MSSNEFTATTVMKQAQFTISPHDPVIIRDGRPFAAGSEGANRARSLDWPYPSTVAGAVRTLIGRLKVARAVTQDQARNPFHNDNFVEKLKQLKIRGPLPLIDGELYVPSPMDFLVYESGARASLRPKPLKDGEGCDLPHQGLWPISIPSSGKSAKAPAFWSMKAIIEWLARDVQEDFDPRETFDGFKKDERMHVKIDPDTQTADDSQLFATQALAIPDINYEPAHDLSEMDERRPARATRIALLVQPPDAELAELTAAIDTLHPFGGERRLARFHSGHPAASWRCPAQAGESLSHSKGIRMLLATPAVFKGGWLPGWLDPETLEGSPPGTEGIRLRLRGACTGRWRAISGWNMQKGHRGPKPVKRLVPSGSVYFFEVMMGSAQSLADLWLCSVSDEPQDRNDGFGLAMWGVWDIEAIKGGSVA